MRDSPLLLLASDTSDASFMGNLKKVLMVPDPTSSYPCPFATTGVGRRVSKMPSVSTSAARLLGSPIEHW